MGYQELVVTRFDLYLGLSEFQFPPKDPLSWCPGGKGNRKSRVHPRTGYEDPNVEYSHCSTPSLTSVLDGGGWSTARPGRSATRKATRYPCYRKLSGRLDRYVRDRNIASRPGFDPRTFQPVASWYGLRYSGPRLPRKYIKSQKDSYLPHRLQLIIRY